MSQGVGWWGGGWVDELVWEEGVKGGRGKGLGLLEGMGGGRAGEG